MKIDKMTKALTECTCEMGGWMSVFADGNNKYEKNVGGEKKKKRGHFSIIVHWQN